MNKQNTSKKHLQKIHYENFPNAYTLDMSGEENYIATSFKPFCFQFFYFLSYINVTFTRFGHFVFHESPMTSYIYISGNKCNTTLKILKASKIYTTYR